jgi:uncharacterized protein YggE
VKSCLVMSLIAFVAFAWMPSVASAQMPQDGKMRIVGRATVETTPDIVTVMVGIANKAPSPTAAMDQNSAVARKIIDFSKKFGIADDDIQTDAVSLNPAFKTVREPNGNTRQEPDGYTAGNTVSIRLRDVAKLGAYMRQVLDQGANTIGGVQFALSNPERAADEARTRAVEDAVRQAQRLAAAAKVKLGAITEIAHPPRSQIQPMDLAAGMPVRMRRAAVPVEAGTVKVTAEVEITWVIQ